MMIDFDDDYLGKLVSRILVKRKKMINEAFKLHFGRELGWNDKLSITINKWGMSIVRANDTPILKMGTTKASSARVWGEKLHGPGAYFYVSQAMQIIEPGKTGDDDDDEGVNDES